MGHESQQAPAVFVGRSRQLRSLQTQWERATDGEPRLIVVRGPPGIGKTALVRQLLETATPARTRWATGDEIEARLPFAVLEQLAADDVADWGLHRGSDPLEVGARLVGSLGDLQMAGPALLVIDDAHWADLPSLQALAFAFRRLQAEAVLVVLMTRVAEGVLPETILRLAADRRGTVIELAGLDVSELTSLSSRLGFGPLPRPAARRLQGHTRGNPLYVTAFLRELGPQVLQHGAGPLPAPQVFRRSVQHRLEQCPAGTRQLVTGAAVLGHRCPLPVAARIADVTDPVTAIEPAIEADLVRFSDVASDELAFSHPLVRSAVYHDTGVADRCRLHERAASVLSGAASLEHQAAATLGHDPDLASALVEQARREVASGAWGVAAAHLETAIRLEPDPAGRERFQLEAVEALTKGGDVAAAAARMDRIVGFEDSPQKQAVLGQVALMAGRQDDAEFLLAAAWRAADRMRDGELIVRSTAQLAQLCLLQARGADSVRWARRALEARSEDQLSRGMAIGVLVSALAIQGRGREALEELDGLPVRVGTLDPEGTEALLGRGIVHLWAGRFEESRRDLSSVASLRTGWRSTRAHLISLGYLAGAEFGLGAWDDSVAHADLCVSLAHDSDNAWLFALAHYAASTVLAARGQFDDAQLHAEAAAATADFLGDGASVGYAGVAAAWLALCRGDHAAACSALDPVRELVRRDGIDEPGVLNWHPLYAEALLGLGRVDKAREALEPFAERAADRPHPIALADATRVRGMIEATVGDADAAGAAFDLAQEALHAAEAPFHQARVDEGHGAFLRRVGERRRGSEHLERASIRYAELGADPFSERCERELAACGLTPARRDPQRRRTLTPQELAVARLVATGLSNRDVAGELVISVKTVEYHLGNIYAKLGIRSRTQLSFCMREGRAPAEDTPSIAGRD